MVQFILNFSWLNEKSGYWDTRQPAVYCINAQIQHIITIFSMSSYFLYVVFLVMILCGLEGGQQPSGRTHCHFYKLAHFYSDFGARGSVVIMVLCYKPDGHGFQTK
jgi:hypothetical protein